MLDLLPFQADMTQAIVDLYDEYTHAPLDRRVFLARLARLTGGMAAALAILPVLESNRALAAVVPPGDPRLEIGRIKYPGSGVEVAAYTACPRKGGKRAAVIVIHENRGLNAHIEDVARRLALEGFLALAPDLLSPLGGTPANEDTARELIGKLDPEVTVANLVSAVAFLSKHPKSTGMVGTVGFCWGGGMAGELAVRAPDLAAAVVYYGRQPKTTDVGRIAAPLLLHYAGLDTRINEGIPAFEEALKKAGKKYTPHLYPDVQHAFHNDTSEARYNKEAALLSWSRTVAFFKEHLGPERPRPAS